jgi:DNA-binding transcriptional regulator YdaS (Cro superfamily)
MTRMDLKTYLAPLSPEQREAFASRCSTSKGHLQNVMYGVRPCATDLAVAIERESGYLVTRPELRPGDWRNHWPELILPAGQGVSTAEQAV